MKKTFDLNDIIYCSHYSLVISPPDSPTDP